MAALSVAGSSTAKLTLNSMTSTDADFSAPWSSTAGIRLLSTGEAEFLLAGSTWTAEDDGVEWVNDGGATASDYECQLVKSTGTDPTSGPGLSSWHTLSTSRQWDWVNNIEVELGFTGTLTVREILNTANSVAGAITIAADNGPI